MELKTHLEEKDGKVKRDGEELARIAAEAGISAYTLYMIALGHKKASPSLAGEIERATAGAVQRTSLRPDIFGDLAA